MIGISIAAKKEWEATLNYFGLNHEECEKYPFGEYFKKIIDNKEVVFYLGGVRKMNASASTQYMIDHFNLAKIIVAGTCAGINDSYSQLDIFIPNKAVQYDCTVKETEPLIKDSFTVLNNFENESILTGTIGTADKPVVMWKDYLELKENNITIADTESAAIMYICRANDVECIVIKGISDFPKNEAETSNEESHEEQLNTFLENIPKIMTKIYDHYLVYALRTSINYQEYESKSTTIKNNDSPNSFPSVGINW